ncbi:Kelch domain-containing protein 10 [Thelohanellus kitauei]|uniref:Kelch domain-containing protein 10 n=1 Tax=Thelohanellus kitauei TaxID=669202 RepID=A0A0C2IZ09_THEKT|nr:Kelch domain-containing protein 10 [Thelohanellus kitauei]
MSSYIYYIDTLNAIEIVTEPLSLTKHSMTSVKEYVIINGGLDDSSMIHNALFTYNTVTNIWRAYQPPGWVGFGMFCSSICGIGNQVYVFGGIDFIDVYRHTNSVFSLNLINGKWQNLFRRTENHDQNTPPPMKNSVMWYHNRRLYNFGGSLNNAGFENTIYKFCLKTSTWSKVRQIGSKPLIDRRIFGTIYKNQFYIFGASLITGENKFTLVNVFDFSRNKWTTKETKSKTQQYPDDRTQESFAFSAHFGYLSGGNIPNTRTCYSDIWKMDLESLGWTKLDYTLKTAVREHTTYVVKDCPLYSFGGVRPSSLRKNTLECFDVESDTLSRVCDGFGSRVSNNSGFIY